jgi:RNA polymerase sigma-54 factor
MDLNMSVKQSMVLSPQMVQSMEILQMGSQELLEYIEGIMQENPALEIAEKRDDKKDEFSVLRRKLEWLDSTDVHERSYHYDDDAEKPDPVSNYGSAEQWEEHLCQFLLSQLPEKKLPPLLEAAAKLIIESLNENGYLDEDLSTLIAPLGCPPELAQEALRLVQSLEPAGVGARNVSECICLQLERLGEEGTLADRIAKEYLDALSRSRYGFIAKALGADPCDVHAACELIRSLHPKPGSGFYPHENPVYITPDIIVVCNRDSFELLTNDHYFPTLSISGYYKSLMKDSTEKEVKDYLTDKMHQAKWVIKSIEQRRSTLLQCAQCILELQEPFFRHGVGHLAPMSLADVAARLGIHESTVSRALKDKYIQCSRGVYPLNYFFSRGLGCADSAGGGESGASPDTAKALLKKLIANEDKKKPLSDQKLSALMEQDGVMLSRRTVAKYRDELGIPGTTGRKAYE